MYMSEKRPCPAPYQNSTFSTIKVRTLESPRNCSLLKETVRLFQISLGICQTNTTAASRVMDHLLVKLLAPSPQISHPGGSCFGSRVFLCLYRAGLPFAKSCLGRIEVKTKVDSDGCVCLPFAASPDFTTLWQILRQLEPRLRISPFAIHGWTHLHRAGW